MAGRKLTVLPALGEFPAADDLLYIVDVTDTSESPQGTSKAVEFGDLQPYKVYSALLTQAGTDAPVATVLQNTLGGTIVWTRDSVGTYTGTLAGAFTLNKTWLIITGWVQNISFANISVIDVDSVSVISSQYDEGGPISQADGALNASIEIRVYP
jgi:hypothetical protein